MLDYQSWLENYVKSYQQKSLIEIEQLFNDAKTQLLQQQQYANLCNLYYTEAATYFAYGKTLKALKILLTHREFINQYAQQTELLRIRMATVVILDSVGYTEGYIDTMTELYEQAVHMEMRMLHIDTLNNIGHFYMKTKDFAMARRYFIQCVEQGERHLHHGRPFNSYFWALLNLMEITLQEAQIEEMKHYIHTFERYTIQDPIHICNFDERLMRLAILQGNKEKAKKYADSLSAQQLEEMEYQVLDVMAHLVETYEQLDCIDEAIEMQERFIQLTKNLTSHAITQELVSCHYDLYHAKVLEDVYIDSLTNTWNRAGFEKAVTPNLSADVYHFFGLLDLDYFKQINDTYGHLIGDEVLREVAKRANSLYLNNEATYYFGRYGGDEFYVYYQGPSEADVVAFAHYFHETLIAESFTYEHMTLPLSVSMGSVYAAETHTYTEWFEAADSVLYEVKRQKRGELYYKTV